MLEQTKNLHLKVHLICSQENSAILKELVELRSQKCSLLGFSTHADFVLEMNMSKASKKVATFLGRNAQLFVFITMTAFLASCVDLN